MFIDSKLRKALGYNKDSYDGEESYDVVDTVESLKCELKELKEIVGTNSLNEFNSYSIQKAVKQMMGQEHYERQADLKEAPLAERIKKLEEYLGIGFKIENSQGYKPIKKEKKSKK